VRTALVLTSLIIATRALLATAQAPPQTPQVPFRAGTDIVEVPVSVVDAAGKPVVDLVASDFEIREDGTPQPIQAIYLATIDPALLASPTGGASEMVSATGTITPARRALKQRVFVFVLDISHLSADGFTRARRGLEGFLKAGLTETDLAGIVANGQMLGDRLVTDKAALLQLLAGVGQPNTGRYNEMRTFPRLLDENEVMLIARGDRRTTNAAVLRGCSERPGECGGGAGDEPVRIEVDAKARRLSDTIARDSRSTLAALQAVVNGLGRFSGPKHIVIFSEGFYSDDMREWVKQITDVAARSDVRFSTLDARGLMRDPRLQNQLSGEQPLSGASDFGLTSIDANVDVLTSLALETGGALHRNRNDLGPALELIARETGTHYVLGYRPLRAFDGSFRRIEVRVRRPGVTVRARRGYVASPVTSTAKPPAPAIPESRNPTIPESPIPRVPDAPTPRTSEPPNPGIPESRSPGVSESVRLRPGSADRVAALAAAGQPDAAGAPDAAARLGREGWTLYSQGNVEGAQEKLMAAVATGSAAPWIHYALGQSEFALQRFDAAVKAWEIVRARLPEYEAVYFDLADGYLQLDRSGDAIAVLRDGHKRWPKDPEMHNALGVILARRRALDEAIESFERAIAVAPADGLGYFNLGRAHHLRYLQRLNTAGATTAARNLADGDRQRAIQAYRKYLTIGGAFEKEAREAIAVLDWR
jgi:VWFA-related protein